MTVALALPSASAKVDEAHLDVMVTAYRWAMLETSTVAMLN